MARPVPAYTWVLQVRYPKGMPCEYIRRAPDGTIKTVRKSGEATLYAHNDETLPRDTTLAYAKFAPCRVYLCCHITGKQRLLRF